MPSRRSTGRSWTVKTTTALFTLTDEGLTQAEIAKQLRRTPKAIERKAAKVRRKLATELRRKSYLTMTFPAVVKRIVVSPQDRFRVANLILGGRI